MKRCDPIVAVLGFVILALTACERQTEQRSSPKTMTKSLALTFERFNNDGSTARGKRKIDPSKIAVVVVDIWDRHWCKEHTKRVAALARRVEPFLLKARTLGLHIVFGPSGTMKTYKDHPARLRVTTLKKLQPPEIMTQRELLAVPKAQRSARFAPYLSQAALFASRKAKNSGFAPLPPWAQSGTCEDGPRRPCEKLMGSVWTCQNAALTIQETDAIVNLDDRSELYSYVRHHKITHLLYLGTASNMCVIWSREGSMMNMMARGIKCAFIEELSIAISGNGYDPDEKSLSKDLTPKLGTKRVNRHLKTFLAPSISQQQILEPDLK